MDNERHMLTDEIFKALVEGIIYVAPEPVTLDGILKVLEGEERERVQAKLDELVADYEQNAHGIQIRQVANGYKFSTKVEHHEILRKYVKSLKPLVRLSKPALETLAVIAYRQPVTMPEIEEIRGVDSGGVIHTLLEKKLVVTSGRKSVVGRPILYRTSKDFLVHFGLKDVGELPSLKEFEELAKRALGSEWATGELSAETSGTISSKGPLGAPETAEAGTKSPMEAPVALGEEAGPIENPAGSETAGAEVESGAVNTEAAPESPPEVSPPVVGGTMPPADSVPTEAAPAAPEESGAANTEIPAVASQESVPPAPEEAPSAEDAVTPIPADDSSDPDRPTQSEGPSAPAATETTPANDATATPEDDEPKP